MTLTQGVQGFFKVPKSRQREPNLARIGKHNNPPRESEKRLKMNLTIFDSVLPSASALPNPVDPNSLYHAFERVPDGRKQRGKRYPLALICTLLLLGKLAGETTIKGAVEWVELRERDLKKQLAWPRHFPSQATYTRALAACDAEVLAHVIAGVILKAHARVQKQTEETQETLRQVAVDGKTLRGTLGHASAHQPSVHVLSWYDPHTGVMLAHRAVPHKRNEISTLADWLSPTLCKDRIITADALHTQRAFCADAIRFGGHYVLVAKKNQPTLLQDLETFFTDPQADAEEWEEEDTCNKGHGRLEQRRIRTTLLLNPLFERE
jgi:predicted transposase YbfD/YdcC